MLLPIVKAPTENDPTHVRKNILHGILDEPLGVITDARTKHPAGLHHLQSKRLRRDDKCNIPRTKLLGVVERRDRHQGDDTRVVTYRGKDNLQSDRYEEVGG